MFDLVNLISFRLAELCVERNTLSLQRCLFEPCEKPQSSRPLDDVYIYEPVPLLKWVRMYLKGLCVRSTAPLHQEPVSA